MSTPATWWSRIGLRTQLLAIVTTLILAALTVTGVALQRVLREQFVGQLDAQLELVFNQDEMNQLLKSANGQHGGSPSPYVVAFRDDATGTISFIQASRRDLSSLSVTDLERYAMTSTQAGSNSTAYYVDTAGKARYRAVSRARDVYTPLTGWHLGTITVLENTHELNESLAKIALKFLLLGLAMLVGSVAVGWWAIRRAFTPLGQVERTAESIAGGDLSQRIPPYPPTTEVGRLTTALNGMLTQIESAFRSREASEARTKRFAADASHELRTPLASIRGYAELYRQGAVPVDEVPRTMERIENEAKRMGGLVEDLLLLARLDEQRPTRQDPVDLLVIAGDAVHDVGALDPTRSVRLVGLNGAGPASAPVIGDDDRLRQVVANLVANAVRHTPSGTPIEVAVGHDERDAVLEVRDHGPGLDEEQAAKVFERFYRADASRQRAKGGGAGLGLSIVEAVVNAHRGTVQVSQTPGGGATFAVRLPTAGHGVPLAAPADRSAPASTGF